MGAVIFCLIVFGTYTFMRTDVFESFAGITFIFLYCGGSGYLKIRCPINLWMFVWSRKFIPVLDEPF